MLCLYNTYGSCHLFQPPIRLYIKGPNIDFSRDLYKENERREFVLALLLEIYLTL
jgi:hypothetical protein